MVEWQLTLDGHNNASVSSGEEKMEEREASTVDDHQWS
jgi:hypothetical protein